MVWSDLGIEEQYNCDCGAVVGTSIGHGMFWGVLKRSRIDFDMVSEWFGKSRRGEGRG